MAFPPPPDEPDSAVTPDLEGIGCPRCGAAYAPGQEYCLDCGLRLPLTHGLVANLREAWTRRVPWYPGDWVWPVLTGLVIAAVAASVLILLKQDAEATEGAPLVATGVNSVPGSTPSGPNATTLGEPPGSTTASTGTTETATTETAPRNELVEWPAGENGYTVVLASIPTSDGRGGAVEQARRALRAGLEEVGVIDSAEYSSLHPGYYVVFSGIHSSVAEARSAAETARASGYPAAYTRQISS